MMWSQPYSVLFFTFSAHCKQHVCYFLHNSLQLFGSEACSQTIAVGTWLVDHRKEFHWCYDRWRSGICSDMTKTQRHKVKLTEAYGGFVFLIRLTDCNENWGIQRNESSERFEHKVFFSFFYNCLIITGKSFKLSYSGSKNYTIFNAIIIRKHYKLTMTGLYSVHIHNSNHYG